MYGIYGDIIAAAEKATEAYSETEELLEYPEVQADKAHYLSVLSKYNELKLITDKLAELKEALNEERELSVLLADNLTNEEREAVYAEISALKRKASALSSAIASAIGCKKAYERAYCRFKFTALSSKFGVPLCAELKKYLVLRGAKVSDEQSEYAKSGYLCGLSFIAEGEDILMRLLPLSGAHKVYALGGKSEELCFALAPAQDIPTLSESDLKVDVFHSHGAGGQNINKVETAIRVTHIPTGITVTCQDERSQLANKKRAIETIKKRLKDSAERTEKNRIDADIFAQFKKKNTPISFDLNSFTMTDTRLKAFTCVPFPPSDFSSYIDGLTVL